MPIIGLDLGRHNFRAVEIEKTKDKYTLLKYASLDNPHLNLDSESKDEVKNYSEALKQFYVDADFSSPKVVISLPEQQVFMRVIKTPVMTDKDLANFIKLEAEQYIPLPMKDVNLSHQKIDIDPLDKEKMNVQIVAAKKSILEKYIEIVKGAKLTPLAIEPETLSIARALGDTEQSPNGTIILNIGFNYSLIIIVYKGFVMFTRNLSIGGDTFTKAIAQELKMDYQQAEEYKKAYGMDTGQAEGKVSEVLKPLFDQMISEIKRSRIFFTTNNPNVNINRMIISGGTAQMPGILYYFANNLDIEVEVANPWKGVVISPKLKIQKDQLFGQGPIYASSFGLAIKNI